MTRNDIESILWEYSRCKKTVAQIGRNIERERARMLPSGIDNGNTKIINSYNDRMSECMAKIDELERKLANAERKRKQAWNKVDGIITKALPEHQYREILLMIYLYEMPSSEIEKIFEISSKHFYRLKTQALDTLIERMEI